MGLNKKRDKKLKNLHSALKSLLKAEKVKNRHVRSRGRVEEKRTGSRAGADELVGETAGEPAGEPEIQYKNGRAYIHSKENQLIPKLTDDEVMERHKLADEKMKKVWSRIIEKYENVEDQGDVVNLHTGEIIADNGHVRNLNVKEIERETRYDSVLKDLVYDDDGKADEVENYNKYSIWEETGGESDEASFTDTESSSD